MPVFNLTKMMEAEISAIVVAAGREWTLPSIVAGLVDVPVIGVPVSTGYGAGGQRRGRIAFNAPVMFCTKCGEYRCRVCGRGVCGTDRE